MTDNELILKIEQILKQESELFDNATEPDISRKEYIEKHNIKTGINYSFSLSAEDIIGNKIPKKVVGCTGVAKVFFKLAADAGLDCLVISTANFQDWEKAKAADINNEKRNIINGHQIIAVQFSDGLRAFDPGRRKLVFIPGDIKVGKFIKSIGNAGPEYLIGAISKPSEFNKVRQYQNISNLYTSGNLNDDRFLIKPESKFKIAAKKLINKIQIGKFFTNRQND